MQGRPGDRRPYEGVRILDLTHRYGTYAGRLFADLGAEVVRVEPPGGLPDRQRASGGAGADPRFVFLNAGKKSVTVDFGSPAGRLAVERLAASAAVAFVERDGPLFSEIGWLRTVNPALVVTAVSPYGMTGPLADAPASELVLQAAGGIAWMSGRIDDAPLRLPFDQATMVGSIYAAAATAAALVDAEENGTGHVIDVSVQECIAHSLQNALQVWDLERRISIRGGEGTRDASEDIFPCGDGFVFLAAPLALGQSWKALVAYIRETGHPSGEILAQERWSNREWRLTREAREAFREAFTAFTRTLDKETLTREAIARRIVLGPVARVADIFGDVQLVHRGFFTGMTLEDGRAIAFPGAPYKLTPPLWETAPAPRLAEHDPLLREVAR